MNEFENPIEMNPGAVPQPETETSQPRKTVGEVIGDALKKGKEDAGEAVRQTVPKMKSAVEKGTYNVAYAASFGVGFAAALFKEMVPGPVKQGVKAGTEAGAKAADKAFTPSPEASASSEAPAVVIV